MLDLREIPCLRYKPVEDNDRPFHGLCPHNGQVVPGVRWQKLNKHFMSDISKVFLQGFLRVLEWDRERLDKGTLARRLLETREIFSF